jgi:hypothetical protein
MPLDLLLDGEAADRPAVDLARDEDAAGYK